jgi:hypothetical protein
MMGRQRRTKASCFTSRRHRGRQQDRQDGLALMAKGERYKDPVALASGRGKRDHRNQKIIVTRTSATDLVGGLQRARPITRTLATQPRNEGPKQWANSRRARRTAN